MAYRAFLRTRRARDYAKKLADELPDTYFATFREAKRSDEQNAKLHAMLTDISNQKPMGWTKTVDRWKAIFMHALKHEVQFEIGLDGEPFPIGLRTSTLTKAQFSDLITYIYQFGDEHGVLWTDPQGDDQ